MDEQEYFMKLQGLEYEANHLGEQINFIEIQKNEMINLKESVEKLEKSGNIEIFSELGKGIFIKSKLEKSDLLIDVGNKILVPKSFDEVKKIVDEQTKKFEEIKNEISDKIISINTELNQLIKNSKEEVKKVSDKQPKKK